MSLIKDLREAKGLSRKELAERVGVSARAVKSWELKERMPRRVYCDRLCRVLGTDKGILILRKGRSDEVHLVSFYLLNAEEG